jgi:WXG100 family type VII secretion target
MPQPIRVNPQELAAAAERVRGYADQLRAGHGSAITAADAAQSGLVGQSAQAISARAQRWQATTAALQSVLVSQATALASASNTYAQTEADNHRSIAALDPTNL